MHWQMRCYLTWCAYVFFYMDTDGLGLNQILVTYYRVTDPLVGVQVQVVVHAPRFENIAPVLKM